MSKFYEFAVNDYRKKPFDMTQLKGKTVLVVNVASQCGLTPQYKGLEELYQKHKDSGLVILGFPSNDFYQEPKEGDELVQSCQRNYGVSFPIMEKIHVNGSQEHELYKFLKSSKPGFLGLFQMVRWNFEKFLVNSEGQVVERYAPSTTPESIEPKIAELLKSSKL
ncbi:hypothetical protein HDU97_005522 [Phlyctochytrium planicorne]|nr:hypothetical protein HDU97_005522 [Phlyctochytrium planicorne]